jgi:sortase A
MTMGRSKSPGHKHSRSAAVAIATVLVAGAVAWFSTAGPSSTPPAGPTETLAAAAPLAEAALVAPLLMGGLPTRIAVPGLGIDAPVAEVGVFMQDGHPQWETAWRAAGHHLDSALPGQPGNMVITGHVSVADRANLAVFSKLDKLAPGDVVEVYSGDNVYRYAVSNISIVAPTAVKILRSKEGSTVTLITCTKDLKHRLVVVGTLV